jgi:hypothetical protein
VLQPDGLLRRLLSRRRAYRAAFGQKGLLAPVALADLERFCHANSTTHVPGDTHGSAQLEGRRQVWLRIQGYLQLSPADLEAMRARAADDEEDTA